MSHSEAIDRKKTVFGIFFHRSALRREIALILLIKLALVLLIKFTFFNHPVPITDIEKNLDGLFTTHASKQANSFVTEREASHEQ